MSDLISRQAAIDALEKVASFFPYKIPGKGETYDKYNEAWNDAIGRAEMEIESLQSAQPELIRCKDCKYSEHWYKDKTRCFLWHETGIDVFEDGYCNYAKRHTDADMRGKQDE